MGQVYTWGRVGAPLNLEGVGGGMGLLGPLPLVELSENTRRKYVREGQRGRLKAIVAKAGVIDYLGGFKEGFEGGSGVSWTRRLKCCVDILRPARKKM